MATVIETGAPPATSGVADFNEIHAARLAAIAEERAGYERRLAGAKADGNTEAVTMLQARIASCDGELGVIPKAKAAPKAKAK